MNTDKSKGEKIVNVDREFGEEEASKLATLRAELQCADEQIDRGDCSEYSEQTLGQLFDEVEGEGVMGLAEKHCRAR